MGNSPEMGMLFVHRKQGLFLSEDVGGIETAGRKQFMVPMLKKWMKLVDIGEATSFLGHTCVGCFQHERKPDESIFDEYRESSNHELLLVQVKNCQGGRNFTHTRSNGLTTLKVVRKSASKEIVKWQLRRQSSCFKSQLLLG